MSGVLYFTLSSWLLRRFGRRESKEQRWHRKAVRRKERFESAVWGHDHDLSKRKYASYEEYAAHQSSKLAHVHHRRVRDGKEDPGEFIRRFSGCEVLKQAHSVLCLGARLGTEVKALHQLGYFAIGVDLNPGAENPYVLPGDFHHLVFASDSVDAVYTNALDHVFDLSKFVAEVRRVLRPGGLFLIDLTREYQEGFVPGEFASLSWRKADERRRTAPLSLAGKGEST